MNVLYCVLLVGLLFTAFTASAEEPPCESDNSSIVCIQGETAIVTRGGWVTYCTTNNGQPNCITEEIGN